METKYNYEDQSLLLAIKDGNEKRHLIYFLGNTTPCYVHTETNS